MENDGHGPRGQAARMKDKVNSTNRGVVVSVRGSVVDVRFDKHLPPIYSVLHAGEERRDRHRSAGAA